MVCGGYALASVAPGVPGNYDADPDPEFSVVEVDESDRSLVQFTPDVGLLLNVGHDHYGHEELVRVFARFLDQCQASVVLATELLPVFGEHGPRTRTTFGLEEQGGDVTLANYASDLTSIRFELSGIGPCSSGQMGRHSALNATAVAAVLRQLGEDPARIPAALASFAGIAQRFQRMTDGPSRSIPVYLDYAHNPEKVRAALLTAREAANGPILAAFQPHGYGPLGLLRAVLAQTLEPKDLFVLLPVYYAGGTTSFRPTAAEVAADYASAGIPVCTVHKRDALIAKADEFAAPARLAVVMGARDPSLPEWTSRLAAAL
jgi:UDP-N-acetylmuramate--alanine ligase